MDLYKSGDSPGCAAFKSRAAFAGSTIGGAMTAGDCDLVTTLVGVTGLGCLTFLGVGGGILLVGMYFHMCPHNGRGTKLNF